VACIDKLSEVSKKVAETVVVEPVNVLDPNKKRALDGAMAM